MSSVPPVLCDARRSRRCRFVRPSGSSRQGRAAAAHRSSRKPGMTTDPPRRLVIGISGASGAIYGIRMLELLHGTDIETHLVISRSAEMTLAYETDFTTKDVRALAC